MNWEKKKIAVVTKAYPEYSTRHGSVACTAGITKDGEWIRLYPIDMRYFVGYDKISKFDIIEAECKKDRDKLSRKESYKVRPDSIRIVDKSLTKPKADWVKRNKILLPHKITSLDVLQEQYSKDKTSLGLLNPKKVIDLIKTQDLEIFEEESWSFTVNLDGVKIPNVHKIPHIFKYKFICDCCGKSEHIMQCEDWEIFESYRRWGPKYNDPELLWEKIQERFFTWMTKDRDLNFIMGMHSQYPTWFIIGLYYPPKEDK